MSAPTEAPRPNRSRRQWFELAATALLALAAVGSAWSSYQANRWNGEQTKASGTTNRLRIEVARAEDLANAEKEADLATFIQWVDAYAHGDSMLQDFYVTRFRPEFKPAFDAWRATDPFNNTAAPPSPFAMPQYRLVAEQEARRLDREAAAVSDMKDEYIQRSANYVLAVVLFAIALFFAGMSSRMEGQRARQTMLGLGCVVFVGAIAWIATFPVRLSV